MKHTVSLTTAQKLKQAGFPQDTHFYIKFDTFENQEIIRTYSRALIDGKDNKKHIPEGWFAAPISDEILEVLPAYVGDYFNLMIGKNDGEYHVWYRKRLPNTNTYEILKWIRNKSFTEALAKMFLFLKEHNIL